jgi:hypothetical protein
MRTTRDVIAHFRREFDALPRLSLTAPQIQRMCGIDAHRCAAVLSALMRDGFLHADGDCYRSTVSAQTRSRFHGPQAPATEKNGDDAG